MTKLQALKKIEQYLKLRTHGVVTFYGIEEYSGGYLAKFHRTYDPKDAEGENRVAFFFVPEAYPKEVHCKFDMIC